MVQPVGRGKPLGKDPESIAENIAWMSCKSQWDGLTWGRWEVRVKPHRAVGDMCLGMPHLLWVPGRAGSGMTRSGWEAGGVHLAGCSGYQDMLHLSEEWKRTALYWMRNTAGHKASMEIAGNSTASSQTFLFHSYILAAMVTELLGSGGQTRQEWWSARASSLTMLLVYLPFSTLVIKPI